MINAMRQKSIDGLKVGDAITFSRTFTRAETEQFGDLTRDNNPVHYDMHWAASCFQTRPLMACKYSSWRER
jgi:3-hydroxybutyryl-CoA dehydratase